MVTIVVVLAIAVFGDRGSTGPDHGASVSGAGTDQATTLGSAARRFTVAAAGDILVHTPVMASARANSATGEHDFDPMFDEVREVISAADLAICHQETPISPDNASLTGYPLFNAPREIAAALANAGFDACEATSNHSLDQYFAGVVATLDVLDEAGLGHTGTGRTAAEQADAAIYPVNGVQVGHLAYTYSYNGLPVPAEAPWMGDLLFTEVGPEAVLADAARLRERGAEFTIVSMQWGTEYQQAPTAEQSQWATTLLRSPDIDLILGDHVHVIQPCQQIDGEYVHYGMGNFLSNQSPATGLSPSTQDGAVVTYEVEERSPGEFETTSMTYAPTFVAIPGHRIELATPDRHPESHQRTVSAMRALGPNACDATPAY